MLKLITGISSFFLLGLALHGQESFVLRLGTNGAIAAPTNFVQANSSSFASGITNAIVVKSNTWSNFPTLDTNSFCFVSSNGVPYAICRIANGSYTTNRLYP